MSAMLKRGPNPDYVELPNGRPVLAEYALQLGHRIEADPRVQVAEPRVPYKASPAPAWAGLPAVRPSATTTTAASPQAAYEAAYDAVLSLPEAQGRFSSARVLAARGVDAEIAARMLAGMDLDPPPPPPPAAPAPVDAAAARRTARLAEIEAAGAGFNRRKGYGR